VKTRPRFTIAVPTYNRGAVFLPQAVECILAQSYSDFELIVSDNGSTDCTPDYLRSMRDPRVRLVRRSKTMPAGEHFSAIAAEATGEYYVMHQDDDILHRDFLARANSAFDLYPDAVIYSCPIWRQEHGRGYHSRLMRHREGHEDISLTCDEPALFSGDYVAAQLFDPIRQFLHPTLAIKTSALHRVGGYDPGALYQSDLVTQARLLIGESMVYDPRPGGVSRVHPSNFMRTKGRRFRKAFFHNSYVELIGIFESAGMSWQPLLQEYLSKLSVKEVTACLFEWTYYQAPLPLQQLGFRQLREKCASTSEYRRNCITKLGIRNLLRYVKSHVSADQSSFWTGVV
jgi:glycosyltransferase involved in cell wall biosynthesis